MQQLHNTPCPLSVLALIYLEKFPTVEFMQINTALLTAHFEVKLICTLSSELKWFAIREEMPIIYARVVPRSAWAENIPQYGFVIFLPSHWVSMVPVITSMVHVNTISHKRCPWARRLLQTYHLHALHTLIFSLHFNAFFVLLINWRWCVIQPPAKRCPEHDTVWGQPPYSPTPRNWL